MNNLFCLAVLPYDSYGMFASARTSHVRIARSQMFQDCWVDGLVTSGEEGPKGGNGHRLWENLWSKAFMQRVLQTMGATPQKGDLLVEVEPGPFLVEGCAAAHAHWVGLQLSYAPAKGQYLQNKISELATAAMAHTIPGAAGTITGVSPQLEKALADSAGEVSGSLFFKEFKRLSYACLVLL